MEIKEYTIKIKNDVEDKSVKKVNNNQSPKIRNFKVFSAATKIVAYTMSVAVVCGAVSFIKDTAQKSKGQENLQSFSEIATENKHRTDDNKGFWYDTNAISSELNTYSNNDTLFDLALYSVYNDISYNRTENMDRIVKKLGFDSFNDYLSKKGYNNLSEYENSMIELSSTDYVENILESKQK